jgi:hypothetical protein
LPFGVVRRKVMNRKMALRLVSSLISGTLLLNALGACRSGPIPGIDNPIDVEGMEFQLSSASYNEAFILPDPNDIVVFVKGEVLSGEGNPGDWEVWVTDENGRKTTPHIVSAERDLNDNPISISWGFDVSRTSRFLTLHLPGEQTIRFDSLIEED